MAHGLPRGARPESLANRVVKRFRSDRIKRRILFPRLRFCYCLFLLLDPGNVKFPDIPLPVLERKLTFYLIASLRADVEKRGGENFAVEENEGR